MNWVVLDKVLFYIGYCVNLFVLVYVILSVFKWIDVWSIMLGDNGGSIMTCADN